MRQVRRTSRENDEQKKKDSGFGWLGLVPVAYAALLGFCKAWTGHRLSFIQIVYLNPAHGIVYEEEIKDVESNASINLPIIKAMQRLPSLSIFEITFHNSIFTVYLTASVIFFIFGHSLFLFYCTVNAQTYFFIFLYFPTVFPFCMNIQSDP